MRQSICICASIIALACAHGVSAATIDVFEMSMTTSVLADGGQDSAYVFTPTNPLVTTRHAQIGMTEATTTFDLAWGPDGGRFDFLFDQVIEDSTGYVASKAFGGVGVVSDVDLWLSYQYSYSYNNLTGDVSIDSTTRVSHITDDGFTWLLDNTQLGGAGRLQPPCGTYSSTYQGLLQAGERYGISYNTRLGSV